MDLTAQIDAAQNGALIIPSPAEAVIRVKGGDRVTWLNGLVTCELAKAKDGTAVYGLFLNKTGRIQADLTVVVESEELTVVVPAREREALMAAFDKYLVMEDAVLEVDDSVSVYRVHGPQSVGVLNRAKEAGGTGAPSDVTGRGGAILLLPKATLASALLGVGAPRAATLGDADGWEAVRLLSSIPRFGVDFDATTYPQEAGLEKRAVSFSKGCYLGQEVVCMIELRGHVKRKIAVLEVDGALSEVLPLAVKDEDGTEVGSMTSVSPHDAGGHRLALAMVKLARADVGTRLQIGTTSARVVAGVTGAVAVAETAS